MLAHSCTQNHRACISDAASDIQGATLVRLPSAAVIQATQASRLPSLTQDRARIAGCSSNAQGLRSCCLQQAIIAQALRRDALCAFGNDLPCCRVIERGASQIQGLIAIALQRAAVLQTRCRHGLGTLAQNRARVLQGVTARNIEVLRRLQSTCIR